MICLERTMRVKLSEGAFSCLLATLVRLWQLTKSLSIVLLPQIIHSGTGSNYYYLSLDFKVMF